MEKEVRKFGSKRMRIEINVNNWVDVSEDKDELRISVVDDSGNDVDLVLDKSRMLVKRWIKQFKKDFASLGADEVSE